MMNVLCNARICATQTFIKLSSCYTNHLQTQICILSTVTCDICFNVNGSWFSGSDTSIATKSFSSFPSIRVGFRNLFIITASRSFISGNNLCTSGPSDQRLPYYPSAVDQMVLPLILVLPFDPAKTTQSDQFQFHFILELRPFWAKLRVRKVLLLSSCIDYHHDVPIILFLPVEGLVLKTFKK